MDFDLYVGANEDGADDDSEEYGCKSGQEHTGEPCCMPLAEESDDAYTDETTNTPHQSPPRPLEENGTR